MSVVAQALTTDSTAVPQPGNLVDMLADLTTLAAVNYSPVVVVQQTARVAVDKNEQYL